VPLILHVCAALLLLVLASDAFTNAVEWIGALYGLTRSAVGAIVSAIGSSLPETAVVFIALVVLRDPASVAVGTGAVIGAPFMLATLAFCLMGASAIALGKTHDMIVAPSRPVVFGLALFACTFALVIGASFAPTMPVRIATAVAIIGAYVVYLIYHMRIRAQEGDEAPPRLRFSPRAVRPAPVVVMLQLAVSAAVTVAGAHWFVGSISALAASLGVSALVFSLLLSPIATELPEMINILTWARRDLDDLALGNVIGAMMFQTSVACSIALLASPWHLDGAAYRAAAATLAAVLFVLIWTLVRKKIEPWPLGLCGLLYVAFVWSELAAR
jgi:cation:H+ antiporter